ncbi:biopolymer transport protein ExbB [Desulfobaculum xiamenense]|uniref:Biopolymer transport protein ExbB n=1 Tax=Desulfobaculum xiamenense TaxID=995050 RepID=A0A846QV66_9BACT|nr:MotA/TolQ/ExbB proton channel family protein [Desulfobaculum xiamenense]NJB68539.1 biopolymer transport protein ExbB [Desulfobaculum xiamenense]
MHDLLAAMSDHFAGGGPVMLPLAAASGLMWWLAVRKFMELTALKREEAPLADCLKSDAGNGWQRAIVGGWLAGRTGNAKLDRRLLERLRHEQSRRAGSRIASVFVLASLAPLLGLLGTVSGMIDTFDAITRFGTGNARAMASGISAALISTQAGLVVAVPGLLAGNMLRRRAERLRGRIKRFCLQLPRGTARREAA